MYMYTVLRHAVVCVHVNIGIFFRFNQIYILSIIGGVSEHETLGNVECYNPETDRWVVDVIPKMNYRRSGLGMTIIYTHILAHTCIVHAHTCIHDHVHTHIHIHIHVYMIMYTHTYTHTHTQHMHTCTHGYTHTHTYKCTHTQTHVLVNLIRHVNS